MWPLVQNRRPSLIAIPSSPLPPPLVPPVSLPLLDHLPLSNFANRATTSSVTYQVLQMTEGESLNELVLSDPSPHDETPNAGERKRPRTRPRSPDPGSCIACNELRRMVSASPRIFHHKHPLPLPPTKKSILSRHRHHRRSTFSSADY